MADEYSLEELYADLYAEQAASDPGDDYLTAEQWKRRWNISIDITRRVIATAVKNGKMERRHRTMTRINGATYPQPVYGFIKKEEQL